MPSRSPLAIFTSLALLLLLIPSVLMGCGDDGFEEGEQRRTSISPRTGDGPNDPPVHPSDCDHDEYFEASEGACLALTICTSDEFEVTPPQSESDRVCRSCRAGDECLGEDTPNRRCGWLDDDADPSTPCTEIVGLGAGETHTCALMESGSVRCWGGNGAGQADVPEDLPKALAISVGNNRSCALTSAARVRCWGAHSDVPSDLPAAIAIAAGAGHTCAIIAGGVVRCWGWDTSGQSSVPGDLSGAIAISAGSYHSCALISGGERSLLGAEQRRPGRRSRRPS